VPDPEKIDEMFAFFALEREMEEEARRKNDPRPGADTLAQVIADTEGRRRESPA
jgi:hypothetical protein